MGEYTELKHPWVDDRDAPLYRLTYPTGASDQEVHDRHQEFAAFYRSIDHPIVWVVDASAVLRVSPKQRRTIAQHLAEIRPYAEKYNVGTGVVIVNPIARGILTAINWITPPPYPQQIFGAAAAAEAFARGCLAGALASRCAG